MNIPDIFSGKIVIGPEPHVDQSVETLDGDKPYVGTLSAVGPVLLELVFPCIKDQSPKSFVSCSSGTLFSKS